MILRAWAAGSEEITAIAWNVASETERPFAWISARSWIGSV
ncbi:MAG TPA: hypothetical protein VK919_09585 [Solirubrobacterales bacterium]|nr:hypothetical protein [Solirubrobacterales bacterium]